jgi:hypothetical protein
VDIILDWQASLYLASEGEGRSFAVGLDCGERGKVPKETPVKAEDIRQEWTQDGTFSDSHGTRVRCYDDIALLESVSSEPDSNGSVITLRAGTTGTVLFFTTAEPCWLQIEYESEGMVFGFVEAWKTELYLRNEEKYPR